MFVATLVWAQYSGGVDARFVLLDIFIIVVGCLIVVFRGPLAKQTVRWYFGSRSERATKLAQIGVVLVGLVAIVMGLASLFGFARARAFFKAARTVGSRGSWRDGSRAARDLGRSDVPEHMKVTSGMVARNDWR